MGLKIKLSSPYLVANSLLQVKSCQLSPSEVSTQSILCYIPDPSLLSVRPRQQMYVFTKDLKQLTADLEVTGDKAAVVKRYKDALVGKAEVSHLRVLARP